MSKLKTLTPFVRFLGMEGRVLSEGQRAVRIMPNGQFGVAHKGQVFPIVADANGVAATCDVIGGKALALPKDDPQTRPAKFADLGMQTKSELAAAAKVHAGPRKAKAEPSAPAAVTSVDLDAAIGKLADLLGALAAAQAK